MKNKLIYALLYLCIGMSACEKQPRKLPIYGERQATSTNVNGQLVTDTTYQTIPDFKFLNQDSSFVTNKFFDGKVYIADFFFTSCTSICPIMHHNLFKVYENFKSEGDILFLSHTVDFKRDKPSVLKSYAQKLGVDDKRWQFLTGTKEEIYPLAEKSYISSAQVDPDNPDGYAHSGRFLLVDRHRRIRGAYDGTDEQEVKQLIVDAQLLVKEK
ncbi:SCO family protein [Emticicia sp. C21]|uniref:SCO family protein n=1 Tax=Emticicia sp. C21 TaxID=2302915 RepID=UPI000E351016|nr:SCO family protein [Emticicia sp. C21]RFS15028.1 SCO family protein [Emticicia sp. C21]